jgi:hypothetical protein
MADFGSRAQSSAPVRRNQQDQDSEMNPMISSHGQLGTSLMQELTSVTSSVSLTDHSFDLSKPDLWRSQDGTAPAKRTAFLL